MRRRLRRGGSGRVGVGVGWWLLWVDAAWLDGGTQWADRLVVVVVVVIQGESGEVSVEASRSVPVDEKKGQVEE